MKKISIYGASGHSKVILDLLYAQQQGQLGYLLDDNTSITSHMGFPVHSPSPERLKAHPLILGIGDNETRRRLSQTLAVDYAAALIHPSAICSPSCQIGEGTVVMPAAVINADTHIGRHAIINTAAVIEHDCRLGDFVHVSPNAALAGGVEVGSGTHIGIGAQVIQGISIGKNCRIGAGAVIIKDVPDGVTLVGNPGRIIKKDHLS